MKNFEDEKHEKRTLESKIKNLTDHGMCLYTVVVFKGPYIHDTTSRILILDYVPE